MNKGIFRLVFNATCGQPVAVAEIASSQSKAPGGPVHVAVASSGSRSLAVAVTAIQMGVFIALGWVYLLSPVGSYTAMAQTLAPTVSNIVADPNAPRTQQATVLTAANGVAQVNIQTPSAMGVSRNTYSSFDVGSQGAILNNSRTNVQTQLGGWVQANPWLATGPARVILNEVNSASPSQLRGYVEVAGQRAEVIIANPAGIQVNGAGFINASGVVLSTGQAQMNGGSLDSMQVRRGLVQVSGTGLDTRDADYTAILARAATVNANLWANHLQVTTGANEIALNNAVINTQGRDPVTPIAPEGAAPSYAFDVGALGGMYAGKIFLVGTEAGLGVRNAGRIETSSGPLTLSQDGWIANTGSMLSAQKLQITSLGSTSNTGTIYASGDLLIQSQASQQHQGTTAALGSVTLQAQGSSQAGIRSGDQSIIASGMDADGQLVGAQKLNIQAQGQVQLSGQTRTADLLTLQGDSINLSQGKLSANQASITALQGDILANGSNIAVAGNLGLSTQQALRTDAARIVTDSLSLQAASWSNVGGSLLHTGAHDLSISLQGNLDNSAGVLQANSRNLTITADTLLNQDGDIAHIGSGALIIGVRQLDNLGITQATPAGAIGSRIATNGSLSISASSTLTNAGTLSAKGDMQVQTATLRNSATMVAAGAMNTTASNIANNSTGLMHAGTTQAITASNTLTNQGQISADGDSSINAATFNNQAGALLMSGADLHTTATSLNNQGAMLALGAQSISTTTLSAGASSLIAAGMDSKGQLAAKAQSSTALAITASGSAQSAGKLLAYGDLSIQGSSIDLQSSTTGSVSGNLSLLATQGDINTSKATISSAAGQTSLQANASSSQSLINQGGSISAKTLSVQLSQLDNSAQGKITQTSTQALEIDLGAGNLNNATGLLVSAGQLSIKAAKLDNSEGTMGSQEGALAVTTRAGGIDNRKGLLQAGSDISISTQGANTAIDNTQGRIIAARNLASNSGALDNTQGLISAVGALSLQTNGQRLTNADTKDAQDPLNPQAGQAVTLQANRKGLLAGTSIDLQTGEIINTAGQIQALGDITVQTNGLRINNTAGRFIAGQDLGLSSGSIDNAIGLLYAKRHLAMTISAPAAPTTIALNNAGGTVIASTGDITLSSTQGSLQNTSGLMQAARDLSLTLLGTNNEINTTNAGQLIAGRKLTSNSGAVDNTGGLISAGTDLTLDTNNATLTNANTLDANKRFGLQAGGAATLRSGALDNRSGYINATGLTVTASSVSNQGGTAISNANSTLTTGSLDNQGGQWLSVGDMRIDADTIDNSAQGNIRTAANLLIKSDGTINNASGVLSAAGALTIAPRTASTPTLQINNAAGSIKAEGAVDINTAKLSGAGTVAVGTDLTLRLQGDHTTQGVLSAGRDLLLSMTGNYTNNLVVNAGRNLSITAVNIDNQVDGQLLSNSVTTLTAAQDFSNRGLVDGSTTRIQANIVTNLGTGRIYGDSIGIGAQALTNKEETIGGITKAASIAARNRLDIGAQTIVNQEHALIYSDGDMAIGGALDANWRATGRAQSLLNASATIEAASDLSLATDVLTNKNLRVTLTHPSIDTPIANYTLTNLPGHDGRDKIYYTNLLQTVTTDTVTTLEADRAKIVAGQNLALSVTNGTNYVSHVITGGTLAINLQSNNITNNEPTLYKTTVVSGTQTLEAWRYVTDGCLFGACWGHDETNYLQTPYRSDPIVTVIPVTQTYQSLPVQIPSQSQVTVTNSDANQPSTTPKTTGTNAPAQASDVGVVQGQTMPDGSNATPNKGLTPSAKQTQAPVLMQVRTSTLPTRIPNTSLYRILPQGTSNYLVETDPQFTQLKTWLGSDYLLKSVALDPAITQKRLGDGFYEQKLIREQVAQLTGRRFLGDYSNDQAQYQALMDNALTTAKALKLRPGIALSAEQMALLTSDIVWMVEQSVTLADGSVQKVLVPQLYVRVKEGDLDGSGSLISGDSINMNLSGDLNNSGTIASRKAMSITADNIKNLGGTLRADQLGLTAREDIDNIGGTLEALSWAALDAGRDVNISSTTQSSRVDLGTFKASQTSIDRVAAVYVKNPGGSLNISAKNNINLTAAQVDSQGSASLLAGNDINLATLTTSQSQDITIDADNYRRSASSKDVGSSIQAAGNMSLDAGNDINAKAASVQAGGALDVNATRDITILAGEDQQSSASASKTSSSTWFSSSTTSTTSSSASNKAIASSFSGNSVSLDAGRNLVSIGTEFKGTNSLLVEGKQDQKFYAATDTSSSETRSESSSSLLGFIPLSKRSDTQNQAQTQALGSKLISDKAITVNIGKSADFNGAELSGDTVSFKNLDGSKPGSLILGGALESKTSSTSSSSETLGLWQKTSNSGSSTQDLKMTSIQGKAQFDQGLQVAVQLPDVVQTSGKAANPNATNPPSIRDANQASVQSQIETLSQQPGLGYLKQLMEGNAGAGSTAASTVPKVQWSQVQLAHDNWKFEQQGLTPAGAALLAIAIAAYTGGMGSSLLGTTTVTATGTATTLGGVTLGTTTAATAGAAATASTYAAGAALNAGFTALASQAAVAMVNNGGDIAKTLEQLGSDQSIKNLLTTMVTAGALQGMNNAMAGASNAGASTTTTATGQSGAAASGVNGVTTTQTANAFTQNLTRNLTNNLAGAVVDSAINNKPLNADTVANALKSSLITSGMASGANAIGDAASQGDINTFTQKVAHAVLGCAGGAASTGNAVGCAPGATGAVVGEMAAQYYMDNKQDPKLSLEQNKAKALAFAKVVSAASGIVAGGGGDNVAAVNVANMTGTNAAENNYLTHNKLSDEEGELLRLKKQKASAQCDTNCNTRIMELETLDKLRDEQLAPLIAACEKAGRYNCKGEVIAKMFAEVNGFNDISMRFESNPGTKGSPFSFNNCSSSDKGGCSYGPMQIAADTGMMKNFLDMLKNNPTDESQYFYSQLNEAGGVSQAKLGSKEFVDTWMKLTAKDPQFVQYQIDALINLNLYPVIKELKKIDIDFNSLPEPLQKALFSTAVHHGAGVDDKKKGADNVMERSFSVSQSDNKPPVICSVDNCPENSVRPFPTYTRQELVYGQVEDQMRTAEESQAKLVKQQKDLITQRESLITQRESLITQRESLITQQLNLERQKSQLLEQGIGASSEDVQRIQNQVKTLDKTISSITEKVTPISAKVTGISTKVDGITNQISSQDQYIKEAAQYLKSQAQGSLADGEQWLKDFYAQRTKMYPAEAARFKEELDLLLKEYRQEQKAKQKK